MLMKSYINFYIIYYDDYLIKFHKKLNVNKK